jgi:hypothetical protein
MFNDQIKAIGTVKLTLSNPTQGIKSEVIIPNLVVLAGREYMTARMKDTGIPAQMSDMEIGQGTTAPTSIDTTIEVAFGIQARQNLSVGGGVTSSNTVTYDATFPAGVGTGSVTEAAIFNDATAGSMLCRTTFPVVNKQAADSLAVSWTVSILA